MLSCATAAIMFIGPTIIAYLRESEVIRASFELTLHFSDHGGRCSDLRPWARSHH